MEKNLKAVDNAISSLSKITVPASWGSLPAENLPEVSKYEGFSDQFVEKVQGKMVMLILKLLGNLVGI